MIDLQRQKRIGIKQCKRTIYKIYKRRRSGNELPGDKDKLAQAEEALARWERVTPRGVKL